MVEWEQLFRRMLKKCFESEETSQQSESINARKGIKTASLYGNSRCATLSSESINARKGIKTSNVVNLCFILAVRINKCPQGHGV